MHQFEDFEAAMNKIVKHPEHHRLRREQFKAEYFDLNRERFGFRTTFGLRTSPPPAQVQPAVD